jgi:CheY-like chemotaxis protein
METLRDKTVLIVDDDERNCFALSSYLDSYDVKVLVAKNGVEAFALLKNGQTVHLILLDIMMPVMDGYEVLRQLKSNERLKDIPVIAVTARAMKGDKEKCIQAGAWDYIAKPIDLKNFISKISSLLEAGG